ncbi:flagellar protein G [Halonotius aquaticus]|uniref:Flagellar protein G n=1 Tax=Halonotius aquaticus TaxID=2216978 RepID=A0A3A6Q4Q3_9EURY|nr:flagellar protein G [Halonotius aquaticus]RJX42215.1 flagellar protein G [Halonotius aquaticus]
MASVSVSHLIIFIASLVVAAGVAGTLTTGVERVSNAVEDGSLDVSQQVRTDIDIVSDPANPTIDTTTGNLTVHVRNTGSQAIFIRPDSVDMVLNGQFVTNSDFTITDANGAKTVARTGDVMAIEIDDSLVQTGDNRLYLTINSDEEVYEFRN